MIHAKLALGLALLGGATFAAWAQAERQAFESYRPFAEQAVGSWKQANDAARDAGGWRAYARGATDAPPPGSPASSAASSAASAAASSAARAASAPASAASGHAGHH